jgi:twitching motility protein PilT
VVDKLEDKGAAMDITGLLRFAREQGASDLHLSAGEPAMVRINGEIRKTDSPPLRNEDIHGLLYDIFIDRQKLIFEEKHEIDFSIDFKEIGRFRVSAYLQDRGEAIAFRPIPDQIPGIKELGLPEIITEPIKKPNGLVLVTGPTGSGKSTTLAAMIELINQSQRLHIITIEDPIEFTYQPKKCLINQREIGTHTKSFAGALRVALRADPDVILVGELRDLETISLAMTAAETGHLVFATLHTSGAAKTVNRIIDAFPAEQQQQVRAMFAGAITAIFSQVLLRRKDGKGRVPAVEVLLATPAIRHQIREGKVAMIPATMQTNRHLGMQTLDSALTELHQKGVVDKAIITPYLSSPEAMNNRTK